MVEQTYRVDMIPNGVPLVVHVSQYDTEARTLIFELYKGDIAYEVPAGAVASIAGTKPDKTAFIYPMAIDGNVVSIDLKQQMAVVAGDVLAEIQITNSSGKIGSANFVIRVERGPIDEDSVISDTDLPIFEELVSDAQAAASEAQTAAETASAAASSVASIVPASAGTAGQLLTKTANGADWKTLDLSGKANTSTLATVESSSIASRAYSVGSYLVYNGILYRVTAAISAGQTLTPGTNISATNAGAELTSLNNGLTNVTATQLSTTKIVGMCYKWGHICMLSILSGDAGTTAANTVLATLPEGYRPISQVEFVDSYGKIRMRIIDNGQITNVEQSTTFIRGTCVFLAQ